MDRRERRGLDVNRGQDTAIRALIKGGMKKRILAGQNRKPVGLGAGQLEALCGIGAAILGCDDVVALGELQKGVVGEIDAGP